MEINSNTISRMGHLADLATKDLEAEYLKLDALQRESDISGLTPELSAQMDQVNRAIDHDYSVIKTNDNFMRLLEVEEKVQKESEERKAKRAAELENLGLGLDGEPLQATSPSRA